MPILADGATMVRRPCAGLAAFGWMMMLMMTMTVPMILLHSLPMARPSIHPSIDRSIDRSWVHSRFRHETTIGTRIMIFALFTLLFVKRALESVSFLCKDDHDDTAAADTTADVDYDGTIDTQSAFFANVVTTVGGAFALGRMHPSIWAFRST
jgi:hypothetical protein